MHLFFFFWGIGESQDWDFHGLDIFLGHSLAIVHGEVLVAPLQPIAVIVSGTAVASTLPVILQDLLKALRTGATQYGGPDHRLPVVGHGRILVIGRSLDAMALRVIHKGSLLDDTPMFGAFHLREIGKWINH